MEHIEEKEPPSVITSDTENATKVEPRDAPPQKKHKFRKFRAYNTGTWNGPRRENKGVVHRQDNLHRFDAIASTLKLTRRQKSQGREVFDTLNLGEFNKGRESIDDVAFAVCVLIANQDVPNGTRHWPHPDAAEDEAFADFAGEINLGKSDQMSIVQRVRARVNF